MDTKYEPGEPAEWSEGVERLEYKRVAGAQGREVHEIVGPCPRCKHELRKDISDVVGPALTLAGAENLIVRVVCNCTSPHEGAPTGTTGCGAEGGVELEF